MSLYFHEMCERPAIFFRWLERIYFVHKAGHFNIKSRGVKLSVGNKLLRMESDKLVEIPPSDWIELRDLFLLNWPENHVAFQTINNYVNWYRKQSYIRHLKIYSLNNSWRSDGTYVVVVRYLQGFPYHKKFITSLQNLHLGSISVINIFPRVIKWKIKESAWPSRLEWRL